VSIGIGGSAFEKVRGIVDRTYLRAFDAYVEFLPSLDDLIVPTQLGGRGQYPPPGPDKIFPVISFTLNCNENQPPTCDISLPIGEYLTNMSGRTDLTGDLTTEHYTFEPVQGLNSARQRTVDQENEEKLESEGVILWYRELVQDTDLIDENRFRWKPIFKGITNSNDFMRVAYEQESLIMKCQHWVTILDNTIIHNAFINTQSADSTFSPCLRDGGIRDVAGEGQGSDREILEPACDDIRKHFEMNDGTVEVELMPSVLNFLVQETNIWNAYPTVFFATPEVLQISNRNIAFVRDMLIYIGIRWRRLKEQYKTNPKFTDKNTGDKANGGNNVDAAFYTLMERYVDGAANATTYYQCLAQTCASLVLTLVCTANSVTMEATRYRTRTWEFATKPRPPLTHSTQITSTKSFAREIVGSVVSYKHAVPAGGDGTQATQNSGNDPDEDAPWAHVYLDKTLMADSENITMGSLTLFDLPEWYNSGLGNNVEGRWVLPGGLVAASQGDGGDQVFEPPSDIKVDTDENAALANLTRALHYELKSNSKTVQVVMPFDINMCVGAPICIQDSRHKLYYSGIIRSFTHTIGRPNNTAQTTLVLKCVDVFTSPDDDMPEENLKLIKDDDDKVDWNKNPYYEDIEAFTGRPIYE